MATDGNINFQPSQQRQPRLSSLDDLYPELAGYDTTASDTQSTSSLPLDSYERHSVSNIPSEYLLIESLCGDIEASFSHDSDFGQITDYYHQLLASSGGTSSNHNLPLFEDSSGQLF
jgi:hypothetical protein